MSRPVYPVTVLWINGQTDELEVLGWRIGEVWVELIEPDTVSFLPVGLIQGVTVPNLELELPEVVE